MGGVAVGGVAVGGVAVEAFLGGDGLDFNRKVIEVLYMICHLYKFSRRCIAEVLPK